MTSQTAPRRKRPGTPERECDSRDDAHKLNCADFERIPSEDRRRVNGRFRCTICIEYGSDDESRTFTLNNKNAHLRTAKHQASLKAHACELQERELVRAQNEHAQVVHSTLLPLPDIPSVLPTSLDEGTANMFKSFRRLGLDYLDENGEQLTFSAGTDLDASEENQPQNDEVEIVTSECSDAESDAAVDPQPGWTARDNESSDYWPYPSKTVSGELCHSSEPLQKRPADACPRYPR
jgi:hypothetical protein